MGSSQPLTLPSFLRGRAAVWAEGEDVHQLVAHSRAGIIFEIGDAISKRRLPLAGRHEGADLRGAHVYADYCSGRIWALRHDGTTATVNEQIAVVDFNVSSFAQGIDLEVYVLEHSGDGGIYKIVP